MVDLIVSKSKYGWIKAISKEATENAYLRISKLALLNAKNSEKSHKKNDYSALVSAHQTPRAEMSVTAVSSPPIWPSQTHILHGRLLIVAKMPPFQ